MKRVKLLSISLALVITATLLVSCEMTGEGEVINTTFDTEPFTGIVNTISADIHLIRAPDRSVEIVAQWAQWPEPAISDLQIGRESKSLYNVIFVESGFRCIGKTIVDLGLPNSIIIALVEEIISFLFQTGQPQFYQVINCMCWQMMKAL